MVIDIGGGTTEIAVIALNGIVTDMSIRVAGDEMDEAIVLHIKKAYNLLIGDQTAEHVKMVIGSATKLKKEEEMEIKGRDLVSGIPKTLKISSVEVREALAEPAEPDRRGRQDRARADAARARRRHRRPGDRDDGRRIAAARARRPPQGGDESPDQRRRGSPHVRRSRVRQGSFEPASVRTDHNEKLPVLRMHVLSFLFDKHLDKTVLAIAVALAIVLLSLGEQSQIEKARAITSFLLYPVERVTGRFASVEALKEENGELRAMVATLYQERERLLEFGEERNRLRKLLDLKEDSFYRFLPCEMIARSSTSFFHSIMVDRGAADSVRVGMAVVGYRGLVGRVSQVFPTSSQVVLINNKSISVSCMNRRSRVVGMLEWDRGSFFRLEYVGKEEDVVGGHARHERSRPALSEGLSRGHRVPDRG